MKTCPYCAEEIQDAAIRCRWCHAWLVEDHPTDVDGPTPPSSLADRMGAGSEESDSTSGQPMDTEPILTSEPPRPVEPEMASSSMGSPPPSDTSTPPPGSTPTVTPSSFESAPSSAPPSYESAPPSSTPSSFESAPASSAPAASTAASTAAAPAATDTKIEFTHTGARYLLGYGGEFFGIWDRNSPNQPIERFPRNDQGWAAAWQRYVVIETNWMDLRTGQKSS
jgi:hypothetical protein